MNSTLLPCSLKGSPGHVRPSPKMRLTLLTVLAFSGLAVVYGESESSALRGFSKKKRWEQCGVLGERKEVPLKTRIVHGEDLCGGWSLGFGVWKNWELELLFFDGRCCLKSKPRAQGTQAVERVTQVGNVQPIAGCELTALQFMLQIFYKRDTSLEICLIMNYQY